MARSRGLGDVYKRQILMLMLMVMIMEEHYYVLQQPQQAIHLQQMDQIVMIQTLQFIHQLHIM
jgi:hypothetical protein